MLDLRRREFITLLGGAAAALPLVPRVALASEASGQRGDSRSRPSMPVIGFLHQGSPEAYAKFAAAFREGLGEAGYVDGRNVLIEYRWAHGESNRLPELAADLVSRRATVIVTPGSIAATLAAKAATTAIPIVFMAGADPIQTGVVSSLNRPGGNVTGVSSMNNGLGAKQLGLLHELLHGSGRFAVLANPSNPQSESVIAEVQAAASTVGAELEIVTVTTNRDINPVFAGIVQRRPDGLLISPDPLFTNRLVQLATLAARHAMPAIYSLREFAAVGGLMTYGSNFSDMFRQAGNYTGRVLNGEKPAEMPILQPTKFELVINLQTAAALGLDVPATLLARADEVIE
jgi:putative tryptophan/tyrosine transport system substrate-binding protein